MINKLWQIVNIYLENRWFWKKTILTLVFFQQCFFFKKKHVFFKKKTEHVFFSKKHYPLSTLRDRYYGKYNPDKHKPGPSTYLSEEEEELLQRHILSMAKIGYGVSKKDVKFLIQEILNKAEAEDPDNYSIENRKFKENLPSTGWVYNFFKRHPILAARTPENLGHQRSCVTY